MMIDTKGCVLFVGLILLGGFLIYAVASTVAGWL
jgi:hypothetical protein